MSDRDHLIVGEVLSVADELACQSTTVALRWIMQRQPEVIPIVGARTGEQLRANLRCLEIELSAEQQARLDVVSAIDPGTPTSFLRSKSGRDFLWDGRPSARVRAVDRRPWWM